MKNNKDFLWKLTGGYIVVGLLLHLVFWGGSLLSPWTWVKAPFWIFTLLLWVAAAATKIVMVALVILVIAGCFLLWRRGNPSRGPRK